MMNFLNQTVSLSYLQIILIVIIPILLIELWRVFLLQMKIAIEEKQISKLDYLTKIILKACLIIFIVLFFIKFIEFIIKMQ